MNDAISWMWNSEMNIISWMWNSLLSHQVPVISLFLLFLCLFTAFYFIVLLRPTNRIPLNKIKSRTFGEWQPVEFRFPDIVACSQQLADIKPLPYRPFRWGPYHITMSIRPLPFSEWIEVDNQFPQYHLIRTQRMRTRGDRVVRLLASRSGVVAGAGPAAIELVHELAEYLSRRHPLIYDVTRQTDMSIQERGWDDAMPVKTIRIIPLGLTYELPLDKSNHGEQRAMEIAGSLTQDDMALMLEGTDGRYYLQGGAICVAGTWRLEDKIGMPLEEIHFSGGVPQYAEKLQKGMGRFFQRLSVDKPVARSNYSIQIGPLTEAESDLVDPNELAWCTSRLGPEDLVGQGNAKPRPEEKVTAANLLLRTERQTLRRLPRTGAVLFTIRTYLFPVTSLVQETGVPGRMASAMRSWPEDIASYKSQADYRDVLLEYLDARHAEQIEDGRLDVGGIDTFNTLYPF